MPTIPLLPTATSVTPDDLMLIVNDPNGTPTTQKARISDIIALANTVMTGASWKGTWSSTTAYAVADVVALSGNTYVSLQASNLNQNPATATTYWQKTASQGPSGIAGPTGNEGPAGAAGLPSTFSASIWAAGTYAKGTAVMHSDGNTYVAVVDNATTDPSADHAAGGGWRMISQRGLVGPKPFTTPTTWAPSTVYTAGATGVPASAVFYSGASYVCIFSHTSPGSFVVSPNWQQIAGPGGVSLISVTGAPLTVNNSNATLPVVGITTGTAGGVSLLTASAVVPPKNRPTWVRSFVFADVKAGSGNESWGGFGDVTGTLGAGAVSSGITGLNTTDNSMDDGFSHGRQICYVIVPADPESTGSNIYNRRIELSAQLTVAMAAANAQVYYSWYSAPLPLTYTANRIPPTVISALAASVGYSNLRLVSTRVHATTAPISASTDMVFWVSAAVLNATALYNWTTTPPGANGLGQWDTITAKATPV